MRIVFKADGRVKSYSRTRKGVFTVCWRIAFLCGLHTFFCWLIALLRWLKLIRSRSRPWTCARSVSCDLPFALVYKSTKYFNITFLIICKDEIRNKITWSSFSKILITQSRSIQISRLAPKAVTTWKHVQTSAYSSIAVRIVL